MATGPRGTDSGGGEGRVNAVLIAGLFRLVRSRLGGLVSWLRRDLGGPRDGIGWAGTKTS